MTDDLFTSPDNSAKRRNRDVWTVSRLNQEVKQLIDSSFGLLWLQGEISNFSKPASGHYYFTLKDSLAQIRCAMFKNRNRYLEFTPETGMQIIARGRLGLYEARGEYQFIVEQLEEVGAGALQRQFEQRYEKLKAEGLFDDSAKLSIPDYPRQIGVITSASGAALQDVLDVLARRYPIAEVVVYPSPVQGDGSARKLAAQISRAAQEQICDMLMLVRGGGSMEDLWSFNEEEVVRAIYRCNIPLICGVGHEIDVTLADFAADLRAPTPSAAAELACPDSQEVIAEFRYWRAEIHRSLQNKLASNTTKLRSQMQRLHVQHPIRQIQQKYQRCDELHSRLLRATEQATDNCRSTLKQTRLRLLVHSPGQQIDRQRSAVAQSLAILHNFIENRLTTVTAQLRENMHALHVASPMATLERGYSITQLEGNSTPLTHIDALKTGDKIHTRLSDGIVSSEISQTKKLG